ncbi:hypothetical protein [Microbacterium sp. GXF0217]
MSDPNQTNDAVDSAEADNGRGATPEDPEKVLEEETTDENGKPLENPSGG